MLESSDEVVLPEAWDVPSKRRTWVRLPSGNPLACTISVLVEYCSVLRPQATRLVSDVVYLNYEPNSELWTDEDVMSFFSALHKDRVHLKHLARLCLRPTKHALSVALGITQYLNLCQTTIDSALALGIMVVPSKRWDWMKVYRQTTSHDKWLRDCLEFLLHLHKVHFREYMHPSEAGAMLELFAPTDIVAVLYSRRKHWQIGKC